VCAESAGATHGFVLVIVEANCDHSIGYPIDGRIRDGLLLVQEEDRCQAIETDGSIRDGAWVVELTDLVDPSAWPEGTRLIMRRERPHPEAPLTLTGSAEGVDQPTPDSTLGAGSMTPPVDARHRVVYRRNGSLRAPASPLTVTRSRVPMGPSNAVQSQ
jgi:hypothetical protein